MSNEKNLMTEFKSVVACGRFDLDFRTIKYLENSYGLSPCFSYSDAEYLITELHDFLSEIYGERVVYNLMMECEKLRSQTFKSYAEACIYLYSIESVAA